LIPDEIPYTIKTITPLHIGGERGIKPALIDLKVERRIIIDGGTYKEVPVIPGSTVKGILRHTYEELLRYKVLERITNTKDVIDTLSDIIASSLYIPVYGLKRMFGMDIKTSMNYLARLIGREQQVVTEDVLSIYNGLETKLTLGAIEENVREKLKERVRDLIGEVPRDYEREVSRLAKVSVPQLVSFIPFISDPVSPIFSCISDTALIDLPNDRNVAIRYLLNIALGRKFPLVIEVCPVCLLFGAAGRSSPLRFLDALPENLGSSPLPIRTRVSIDRNTLTAKRGKLYTLEYIPPGTVFKGSIYVMKTMLHPIYRDIYRDLLLLLFKIIQKRMIGGLKTTGMGVVEASVSIENSGSRNDIIDRLFNKYLDLLSKSLSDREKELIISTIRDKLEALGHDNDKIEGVIEAIKESMKALEEIIKKLGKTTSG